MTDANSPVFIQEGNSIPRLSLRPREAAEALGISERLLWSLSASGQVPCVRLGRTRVYPISELRAWLEEHSEGGALR